MKGLELSRAFFEEYGRPMLESQFPDLLPFLAAGLTGSGSECFGFDDEISQDHDFEPGFILFLPDESVVDRRSAFLLERSYEKLPREFLGFHRSWVKPVGGARRGILRMEDFFLERTGTPNGQLSLSQWLLIPPQSLAEVVNGELFFDHYGQMTRIRQALAFFPEDIRRKRLAGHLLMMGQSGQYNYLRCIRHGETGAAQLAAAEFVRHALSVFFLLFRTYQPYYKWTFRALRNLPGLDPAAQLLEYLLTTDNQGSMPEEKAAVMESLCDDVIDLLRSQGLTDASCRELEQHARSVNDRIEDAELRNRHILAAV